MKKLSIFLCLITMFVFFPFSTGCSLAGNFGGDSSEIGILNSNKNTNLTGADDFNYRPTNNDTIIITGVKNTSAVSASIPAQIDGKDVVCLDGAFKECEKLKSVEIPATVNQITNQCFKNCSSLVKLGIYDVDAWCKIDFNDALDHPFGSSGGGRLYKCSKNTAGEVSAHELTEIEVTAEIKTLEWCFMGCKYISKVTLNSHIEIIETRTFFECESLESISGISRVRLIGQEAFSGCLKLESIALPSTLSKIDFNAFGNSGLTSITIPGSVTELCEEAFSNCSVLRTVVIDKINTKSGVTEIPVRCFSNCSNLENLTIKTTLNNVYGYAFDKCGKLKKPTYTGEGGWNAVWIDEGNESLNRAIIS